MKQYLSLSLGLVALVWAQRTWYFSSSQGNDNNDGRTPQTALRSMQKLQELLWGWNIGGRQLQRGDTIAFLRGDTFRVIWLSTQGLRFGVGLSAPVFRTSGAPIVIQDYGSSAAPLPLFTGTWRLSDSARAVISDGNIVKVAKPFGGHDSLVTLRVFWRGKPLRPARFPNDSLLVIERSKSFSKQEEDTLVSSGLQGLSTTFVQNALIWAAGGADFAWVCNRVVGVNGNELITRPWTDHPPLRGARFYLEGRGEFIDQPGEWYYDETTDTLYLWPPQLPFNPNDYELLPARVRPSDRDVALPRAFTIGAWVDTIPDDAPNNVTFQNLHLLGVHLGIFTFSVRNITIRRCFFTHSFVPVSLWRTWDSRVEENTFEDNEGVSLFIYGTNPAGYVGHPKVMTRRVWVERNSFRRMGLYEPWSPAILRIDSTQVRLESKAIILGNNLDSVIVRLNRIDSVSQGGIGASCFHRSLADWNAAYAGTVPFIIEKNLISNFCMDFSDCGGIKVGFFVKGGIIRNNILIKGSNRDKSHLSWPVRPFAKGLYSDVEPQDVVWEGNTVIGASVCCHNFHGEDNTPAPIRNIKVRQNTFYNCQRQGVDFVPAAGGMEECEVTGNIFFLGMHEYGGINIFDGGGNGQRDTAKTIQDNWYGHPTYAPAYTYWQEANVQPRLVVMGFRDIRTRTPYEQSPQSRWLHWVSYKQWQNAQVSQSLTTNPFLDPTQSLPIEGGYLTFTPDPNSPFGTPAIRITYTSNAPNPPNDWWIGIYLKQSEPFYTTLLDSSKLYRWRIVWASNRVKDYNASIGARFRHPNVDDTLGVTDRFVFPIYRAYTPETLEVWYKPRFRQFWSRPYIRVERGDTLWIKEWKLEEISPASVPSLGEVYPIYVNPSDTIAQFPLPSGWVYLTLDSTLVWGRVSVQPWKSRILVRVRYDSTLAGVEGSVPVRNWALVYPNPTSEAVKVLVPEEADYELLNVQGQLLEKGWWAEEGTLSLATLPQGLYFLRLRYRSGHQETVRVVRE